MPPGLLRKLFLHVCPILWVGYAMCLVDRGNMGMGQLQMAEELKLSQSAFGLSASAFFITYTLLQIPVVHLLTRLGARPVLALMMIGWGLVSAAHGLVRSSHQLVALRLVLGITESGFYPGVMYFLTRWFPDAVSGQAAALFMTAGGVGAVLGSATGGIIMDHFGGVWGLAGWRWLFILQGLPGVPLGVALLYFLDESPAAAGWLTAEEHTYLATHCASQARADVEAAPSSVIADLRRVWMLPTTWVFGSLWFAGTVMYYTYSYFGPTIAQDMAPSLSTSQIGLLMALPAAVSVLGAPLVARWADHGQPSRRRFVAWNLPILNTLGHVVAVTPLLLVGATSFHSLPLGSTAEHGDLVSLSASTAGDAVAAGFARHFYLVVVYGVLTWIITTGGPFWALHHRHQPAALLPLSIATVNMCGQVGGLIGPMAFGLVHDSLGVRMPCLPLQMAASASAPAEEASCATQWALPVLMLHGTSLTFYAATGVAALILGIGVDPKPRAAQNAHLI